jgi:CheY-like chemotaxis protein
LVVEDNPVNALVAQGMLEQLGWASEWAQDGEQALALLMQHRYALVLMDCQMPVLDGFETTRRWRAHEQHQGARQRLPILALTANALQGDSERCRAAGMDDYLSKPFDSHQLSRLLNRYGARSG